MTCELFYAQMTFENVYKMATVLFRSHCVKESTGVFSISFCGEQDDVTSNTNNHPYFISVYHIPVQQRSQILYTLYHYQTFQENNHK